MLLLSKPQSGKSVSQKQHTPILILNLKFCGKIHLNYTHEYIYAPYPRFGGFSHRLWGINSCQKLNMKRLGELCEFNI